MTVNWWTIALQAINFLVLVWLLQRFLYRPVLAVIAKRRQQVELAFADADKAKAAAAAEQQRYEAAQADLAQSRQAVLSKAHADIEADRQQVLDDAQAQANTMLETAREQIAAERDAALTNLKAQIADLAVDMAQELLQRVSHQQEAAAPLNDAFLAQVTDRLDQLSDEQRLTLVQDLRASTDGLRIVTATALDAEAQQRWQQALETRIGPTDELTFLTEPDLIGGAELRFPHALISLSWSEQLREGRQALLGNEVAH